MAEKTPRQKKRKASQEVAPLPDDEKRFSKVLQSLFINFKLIVFTVCQRS